MQAIDPGFKSGVIFNVAWDENSPALNLLILFSEKQIKNCILQFFLFYYSYQLKYASYLSLYYHTCLCSVLIFYITILVLFFSQLKKKLMLRTVTLLSYPQLTERLVKNKTKIFFHDFMLYLTL